jgi:uncharacterized integral membrane protein (TIGR00698 family)
LAYRLGLPYRTAVSDQRPTTSPTPEATRASVLPGLLLAVALAVPARLSELIVPAVPGVVLALLLGVIVRQGRPAIAPTVGPGVKYVLRWVLRSAIVLLGATLSFQAVLATGSSTLVIILVCVSLALGLAFALGRAFGVSGRAAALIGAGTAICGGTAIVTVGPLISASDDEIAYAITTIFAFNVIAIVTYPVIGHALGMGPLAFGTWTGTAVNDTSAVVATGFLFSSAAAATATIVKLTRTVLLVPLAVAYGVGAAFRDGSSGDRPSIQRLVLGAMPWFVLMFVALALANTVGWIPTDVAQAAGSASRFLIVVVLAAVGLNISIPAMIKRGPRPLALGFAVAGLLSAASFVLVRLAGLT